MNNRRQILKGVGVYITLGAETFQALLTVNSESYNLNFELLCLTFANFSRLILVYHLSTPTWLPNLI